MFQLQKGALLVAQTQQSASVLRMRDITPLDIPGQLLEQVIATASRGTEHGGMYPCGRELSFACGV